MRRLQDERRDHPRCRLTCPIVITDSRGKELMQTQTLNISDGGLLLEPGGKAIGLDEAVHLNLRIPRTTDNTFMYEDFFSGALVVRHQSAGGGRSLAMAFTQPLQLELEV